MLLSCLLNDALMSRRHSLACCAATLSLLGWGRRELNSEGIAFQCELVAADLWADDTALHQVVHGSCLNLCHGSKLSPPRREQMREALTEYFNHATDTDPWFQWHVGNIRQQMFPHLAATDIGVDEVR